MQKSRYVIAVAAVLATASFTATADAGKLLGGLIKTGGDSGNSSSLVSTNPDGSIGFGGSGGISVGSGGSGGSTHVGVDDVATLDSRNDGGTQVDAKVLGGGGSSIGTGDLLGNDGVNIELPGTGVDDIIGGLLGGDAGNGSGEPGGAGGNGGPGGGLGNGGNFYPPVYYPNGGSGGGSFVVPDGISARLRMLLKILQERDYLRVADGPAVCLGNFGVARIGGWLPQKDYASFNRLVPRYSRDIATLRQLLANCRDSEQRQALNGQINRVITLDLRKDGTPILFVL